MASTVGEEMRVLREKALHESWMLRARVAEPRPGWGEQALCVHDPDQPLFDSCERWREAAAICAHCPVRLDCLAAAWKVEQGNTWRVHGVRGGLPSHARVTGAPKKTAAAYAALERHVAALPADVYWSGHLPVAI